MVINGRHHGPQVTPISIPLRRAIEEAAVFLPEFEPIVTIDRSEYYFIRMRRVQRCKRKFFLTGAQANSL